MSKMKDKAIEKMNRDMEDASVNLFLDLRNSLRMSRSEGTDLPIGVIGKLIATEVCKDQWEARAIINAIQIEWEV